MEEERELDEIIVVDNVVELRRREKKVGEEKSLGKKKLGELRK